MVDLARTGWPDEGDGLARRHAEGHMRCQRRRIGVSERDILERHTAFA